MPLQTRAWCRLVLACLDEKTTETEIVTETTKHVDVNVLDERIEAHTYESDCKDDDIKFSKSVYKLQLLYATDLLKKDSRILSGGQNPDTFCVVLFDGAEVAKSEVTPHSANPIFRTGLNNKNLGFCVRVPRETVFGESQSTRRLEYVVQVYNKDGVGPCTFLGEIRLTSEELRQAVGRRAAKKLQPMIGGSAGKGDNRFVGGLLHYVGHLIPAQPHFALQIVEAKDLSSSSGQVPERHDTCSQGVVRREGAHKSHALQEVLESGLNPFAVCYAHWRSRTTICSRNT